MRNNTWLEGNLDARISSTETQQLILPLEALLLKLGVKVTDIRTEQVNAPAYVTAGYATTVFVVYNGKQLKGIGVSPDRDRSNALAKQFVYRKAKDLHNPHQDNEHAHEQHYWGV